MRQMWFQSEKRLLENKAFKESKINRSTEHMRIEGLLMSEEKILKELVASFGLELSSSLFRKVHIIIDYSFSKRS